MAKTKIQSIEDIHAYKKSLEGKTLEELKALEQEIIKEADEANQTITAKYYDLPDENKEEICEYIRYFINKQSVGWKYTVSLMSLYDFWTADAMKIQYPYLDSTLRMLGGMQFTGYDEWKKVDAINNYVAPIRDQYIEDSAVAFEIAERHNVVMDLMGLENPIKSQPQE